MGLARHLFGRRSLQGSGCCFREASANGSRDWRWDCWLIDQKFPARGVLMPPAVAVLPVVGFPTMQTCTFLLSSGPAFDVCRDECPAESHVIVGGPLIVGQRAFGELERV